MKRNESGEEGDAEPDQVGPATASPTANSDAITGSPWTGARGQLVRMIMPEAVQILKEEGYIVGRIAGPDLPFDLREYLDGRIPLLISAVAGQHPIRDEAGVVRYHRPGIERIQPFRRSDTDRAPDTGKAQRHFPALVRNFGRLRTVLDRFSIGSFDLTDRILHRLVEYDEKMNRLRIRRPA
jgi:hypothetical protein